MTAIEVVTAYSTALSQGDIPTAFSHLVQMQNGTNPESIGLQELMKELMPLAKCWEI